MIIFNKKNDLLNFLNKERKNKSVGFVPTMGGLHSGHLQLVKLSLKECSITICSIFINPTQFNNINDFKKYPNTLSEDLSHLKQIGCEIVYNPDVEDLYEENEKAKKFNFGSLSKYMEGQFRPGHFDGMATVVEKFFNIIKPTKAFFGFKDLQQLQIVKTLVKQMKITTKIIGVPTIREQNGLAKSSRNNLLSFNEKNKAALIYKSLNFCLKNKDSGINKLKSYVKNLFDQQKEINLEYIEFVEVKSMRPISKWKGKNKNAICIAAIINNVRLIDNIIL